MVALAESHETHAPIHGREWIAADMTLDPSGDFMTGVVGFSDEEQLRAFEDEAFSWLKGPIRTEEGASERTMVPFAIDLRENHRWVGFATSTRIRPSGFVVGFAAALNAAVGRLGLLPSEWEVDLVVGRSRVEEWIELHPDVFKLHRVVRRPNPGRRVDDDLEAMRRLGARQKKEEYTPGRNRTFNLRENDEFEKLLEGLDTGDVEITLHARHGSTEAVFRSRELADFRMIDDFGRDLSLGMQLVLDAVRQYATEREAEAT